MFDLNSKEQRDKLAEQILSDIDEYCEKTYENGHRNHLGASEIGEKCWRKLWYKFRWVKEEKFEGRMLRLFNVGHAAEPRFISYLRGIGFEVWETDPETGKQFRIDAANKHYGGSCDGKARAPARYQLPEDLIFLNEFKTNNTGSGFTAIEEKGVEVAKPKHYAQMCQYGRHFKLKYGLYLIENKNDSSLIIQIVPLDWNLGQQLENKANDIINARLPPNRISDNPSYFECKFCHCSDICHFNAPVEKNCRSCKQCEPVDNAEWFCHRFKSIIPPDFIPKGCPDHQSINEI